MSPDIIILLLGLVALMALGIPICFAMMSVASVILLVFYGSGLLNVLNAALPWCSLFSQQHNILRKTEIFRDYGHCWLKVKKGLPAAALFLCVAYQFLTRGYPFSLFL